MTEREVKYENKKEKRKKERKKIISFHLYDLGALRRENGGEGGSPRERETEKQIQTERNA